MISRIFLLSYALPVTISSPQHTASFEAALAHLHMPGSLTSKDLGIVKYITNYPEALIASFWHFVALNYSRFIVASNFIIQRFGIPVP